MKTCLFSFCLYHLVCFYAVSLFDVIVVFKYKTTLIACPYFLDIILESLERRKRAVKDYDAVTDQTDRTVSLNALLSELARSCRDDA